MLRDSKQGTENFHSWVVIIETNPNPIFWYLAVCYIGFLICLPQVGC